EAYRLELEKRLGPAREIMRVVITKAQNDPKRIVFPEGQEDKILRASQILIDDGIARPILLGKTDLIRSRIEELDLDLGDIRIINPRKSDKREAYIKELYNLRRRKGIIRSDAEQLIKNHNTYGSMMVRLGDADGLISGLTQHYPDTIRPALQIIEIRKGLKKVSGLYMLVFRSGVYFFADTTVNINPSAEDLAEIALCAAETAREFDVKPRVAMLSYSNFGSVRHDTSAKVQEAVEMIRKKDPSLPVDGEMQADTAVVPQIAEEVFPFSVIKGDANVLIFPDLASGNISYKLMMRLGGAEAIGPILMGMSRPVHVLQRGSDVDEIVNMAAICVVDAQKTMKRRS
ncbi:phosphate acetyltransferase, partial [candidate division KSB1 bacterium]